MHRILLATLLLAGVTSGDVLVLDDGSNLAGEVERVREPGRDGYVVKADGKERFVPIERVVRHVVGRDTIDDADDAASLDAQRLASLRRVVQRLDDPAMAVAKYEEFLKTALLPDVVFEASRERDTWQRRVDQGLIRHGDAWLTPAERDADVQAALGRVDLARQAVAIEDAQARVLVESLLGHPTTDVSGRYLQGVLDLSAGQLASARQHFASVRDDVPDHAPTLLNLAFIQAELGRPERAAVFAADAAEAAPETRVTLDNLHELLAMLSADQLQQRHARRAVRLLDRYEPALRAIQAERGLSRWGSDWIDQATADQFAAERAELQAEFDTLKEQFDELVGDIDLNARRIADNERFLERIERNSVARDASGNLVRVPLPESYYDVQRENQQLQRDQARLRTEADALDQQGAALRAKMPQPTYRGRLFSVGAEGVPVILPATPTTRPTD
ncbi:MAG: tetratricopeptide repeat protein [Planctomycetota bacterium]